jgi:hypothetical protein
MKNITWMASAIMAIALIGLVAMPARAADMKIKTGLLAFASDLRHGFSFIS